MRPVVFDAKILYHTTLSCLVSSLARGNFGLLSIVKWLKISLSDGAPGTSVIFVKDHVWDKRRNTSSDHA
jgi:hypothetical protein